MYSFWWHFFRKMYYNSVNAYSVTFKFAPVQCVWYVTVIYTQLIISIAGTFIRNTNALT